MQYKAAKVEFPTWNGNTFWVSEIIIGSTPSPKLTSPKLCPVPSRETSVFKWNLNQFIFSHYLVKRVFQEYLLVQKLFDIYNKKSESCDLRFRLFVSRPKDNERRFKPRLDDKIKNYD